MTQESAILEHLKKYGQITSMEAFTNYGVTRLSARIYNLRKAGYNIGTVESHTINRYGHNTNYATYVYKEGE